MFTLIKLFSKDILGTEVIQRFHFDAQGEIFAVETDKAVYKLMEG